MLLSRTQHLTKAHGLNMKSFFEAGFFVNYKIDVTQTNDDTPHLFCGEHSINGGICPNCNKPLLRFLTINLKDKQLKKKYPIDQIHLMYCWTCNISQDIFVYKITSNNAIKIIKYLKDGVVKKFPYENYPKYFPFNYCKLEPIPEKVQNLFHLVNTDTISIGDLGFEERKLFKIKHQVGGEPYLVQKEFDEITCPVCKTKMAFLACIANDNLDSRGFVANSYVQILYYFCDKCHMISAVQRCD